MSMFAPMRCRSCGVDHGPHGVCDNPDCSTNQVHDGAWVRGELGPHWVDGATPRPLDFERTPVEVIEAWNAAVEADEVDPSLENLRAFIAVRTSSSIQPDEESA